MQKSNAIIVVFLSHGDEDGIIYTRDKESTLFDFINMLTPDRVPQLVGRPKIILVQACRGGKLDHGVIIRPLITSNFLNHVPLDNAAVMSPAVPNEEQRRQGITMVWKRYPRFADFLIGYSSHDGHISIRTPGGTLFIQDFCSVLQDRRVNLRQCDITEIFRRTIRSVTSREDARWGLQVPSYYSTLTKSFYLVRDVRAQATD